VNPEYAAYCQADRDFYDAPNRLAGGPGTSGAPGTAAPARTLYAPAAGPAPDGWEASRRGDWLSWSPRGVRLPQQGWKIHISAALDNAEAVLAKVVGHCVPRRLPFKFIAGPSLLLLRNGKYADRAGSGKFITVYPHSEAEFPEVCIALTELLDGEHGPYILSDLRCGSGPVHVRYGSFAARFCPGPDGRLVPAIADPGGRLVPDPRGPSLTIPPWVTPPPFLRPHLEARGAVGLGDLPYEIQGALHFSNGGGVYRARSRHDGGNGENAVLKEARPHAGLAADGADAPARLERERGALETLAGLDCVPRLRETFELGGHHFLAMEYIPGTTLNTLFARRFPLSGASPSPEALAEHADWARRIHRRVERAVEAVHSRGLVIGDLHLSNVMVSDDESRVTLLDFEAASPIGENRRQIVANPAFVAPPDRRGAEVDHYALACLRLALLLPLTTLLLIDRRRVTALARDITRVFPVTEEELRPAVEEILRGAEPATPPDPAPYGGRAPARTHERAPAPDAPPGAVPDPLRWPAARESMARAIHASATPDRTDRLFPGDIAQFAAPAGGLGLAHGAAGVLHALHETGAAPVPGAADWLLARCKEEPASGTPLGLYDGLAGIAWLLDRVGHTGQALELARLIRRQPLDGLPVDLHSGLAGIALVLDGLAAAADGTEAAALRRTAAECAALTARAVAPGRHSSRTGLLRGGAGPALMFIRRYESTGDPGLLDLAATALHDDLARCRPGPDGTLLVLDGKRTMPYLGGGSAGLALVIDDYLAHRPAGAFEDARQAMQPGFRSAFYIQPGLFRGVAGIILHLARTPVGDPAERHRAIAAHTRLLGLQATPYAGELAFPGEQLMRRSMDLATGTAGCLLALGSVHDPRVGLPFLPPPGARPETRPHPGAVHKTDALHPGAPGTTE
jgi:hypothetical protein